MDGSGGAKRKRGPALDGDAAGLTGALEVDVDAALAVLVVLLGDRAGLLPELGDHDDERHRAAPLPLLLVDLLDPGLARQPGAGPGRRPEEDELLLCVETPLVVHRHLRPRAGRLPEEAGGGEERG